MNSVETALLENIDRPGSLFVFPTDVAASRWADRLLCLRRTYKCGGGTVAMEKFIAWDTFKQQSIRSKVQDRQSIPSVLRKMFVSGLVRENARLCAEGKPPIFASLIPAAWAQQADSFAPWLAEMLPQLALWLRQTAVLSSALTLAQIDEAAALRLAEGLSADDRDLFTMAIHYSRFLEQHNLFEPSWETPPFDNMGNECFIFFPESLFDFGEYQELLEASDHVTIVHSSLSETERQSRDVFYYTNSRSEIIGAALYIMALHNNRSVPWDSISVSIPENDGYGPYLLREFENRNIPYTMRSAKPLAAYPAGQFFRVLADCASGDFSFSSLTALLLNRHLPWKDGGDIQDLVEFGIKNNCIHSWTEVDGDREIWVNVWEDAFAHPFGGFKAEARRFFDDLRRRVTALRKAASFGEIRKQYFAFRERFFDMENVLSETDTILSRCISELMYLAEIEASFPDVQVPDPYAFFASHLEATVYLAQQATSGVAILPYRTAAPAPFDCHIVLGASQDNLSTVFSPLAFLSRSRREKIGMADSDASQAFIDLHQFNSRLPAAFFCSEQSFSGYAIPYSTLNVTAKPQSRFDGEQFAEDFYRTETTFHASLYYPTGKQAGLSFPQTIHGGQKRGFEAWLLRRGQAAGGGGTLAENHPLLRLIRRKFCGSGEYQDLFSVSPSSLGPYFQCPLKWVFERVLLLENTEVETSLMASNTAGMVYHAVLNLFLDEIKNSGRAIAPPVNSSSDKKPLPVLPDSYRSLLAQKVAEVFATFPRLPKSNSTQMSMLTARLLHAEQQTFYTQLEQFLAVFISYFAGYRVSASESYYSLRQNSYYLSGIVDCILEDDRYDSPQRGTAVIVDFKTKYMPNLSDCTGEDGLADFQLPLYLRLAETALKKEVHTALFFSIVDATPQVLFGTIRNMLSGNSVPKNEDDRIERGSDIFVNIMKEFDEKAGQFAQEIADGTFAFQPLRQGLCAECGHEKVCRSLYTICQGKNDGI
jgi:hypothetical protein